MAARLSGARFTGLDANCVRWVACMTGKLRRRLR